MSDEWRIELFGGLRARHGNQVVTHFRTYKTGALLAYLSFHLGRPHRRETLVDLLWPDADLEAGRQSLNVALSALRRQLEDGETPTGSVVVADRSTVHLDPRSISTDVEEFKSALR